MPTTKLPMPVHIGVISPVIVSNPGANTNFQYAGVDQERYRILSIRYTFAADANAANRNPALQITISAVSYVYLPVQVVTANQTYTFQWLADGPPATYSSPPSNFLFYRLPFMEFDDQMGLSSICANMQAGDTFTDIRIILIKWVDPIS